MKNIYHKAWQIIQNSEKILIVSHKNPDTDAISSSLAIYHLLLLNKKKSKIINFSKLPNECNFLNGFKLIKNIVPKDYDLIISLDSASKDRWGFELDNQIKIINIDHHITNNRFGTINLIDADAVSTTQVIYTFIAENKLLINKTIAEAIYSGIFIDSGSFQYERVNHKLFKIIYELTKYDISPAYISSQLLQRTSLAKIRAKALILDSLTLHFDAEIAFIELTKDIIDKTGVEELEIKDTIKDVLNIKVVKIAIFLREQNKNETLISIRSKNKIDISKLSLQVGGGGHKYSAGAVINKNIDDTKIYLLEMIKGNSIL